MRSGDDLEVISDVQATVISLPLGQTIATIVERESAEHRAVDCVLVQLLTQSGVTGIGLAWTLGLTGARAIQQMVEGLAPLVVGEDPMMSQWIWTKVWRFINPLGHAGISLMALSALDIGIWDVRGKLTNRPVYQLLGGHRRELPLYVSGMFLSSSIEAIVDEAKGYVAAGFTALKMRVGSKHLDEDLERVEAVRRAIGSKVMLMVDAAQAWDANRAMRACRALDLFNLGWIEDPVPFDYVDALAAIAAAIDTPITTGEKLYSRSGFRQLLERHAADILMPDVQRVGGITGWMGVAALAQAWDIPVTTHVLPEISAHVLAATPGSLPLEQIGWLDRLFRRPLSSLGDGVIRVPDSPGLGIELDSEAIARCRVR